MNNYSLQFTNDGLDNENKVGIWIKDVKVKVSFPKQMNQDKKDVRLLIKTLEKYARTKDKQMSVIKTSVKSGIGSMNGKLPLGAFFEIIDDYIEHGYYLSKTVHFSESKGRTIDFNKTIKKVTPNYYQGSFIYPKHIKRTKRTYEEELLRLIHKYVVYKISHLLEFYYGQIPVEDINELPVSKEQCINYLKQELFNSTNDYKIRLITLLLAFFEGTNGDDNIELFIETSNFELIWEEMLRTIFSNAKRRKFFFNTSWYLYNSEGEVRRKTNKDSELDLIKLNLFEEKNHIDVFVIDAKYYSYSEQNNKGTLPQTTDINKQVGYLYYVRQKIQELYPDSYSKHFYNVFIIPHTTTKNDRKLEAFGYAVSEMDRSEKIIGINADVKTVMSQYIKPNMVGVLNNTFDKEILKFYDTSPLN
ncbi:LlaJI family restriction endonuclease [Aquibacillus sediminis]|uniref:LlaJI family restriction endonuclease n=1 Tax=Aquibacillus sediminis TaxID=2574734 RepID=UPI0014875907|nr:LlaJI family restriction endonuclease [Aquibacillus sediminis]